MSNSQKYTKSTISADDAGSRLDRWFKRYYPQIKHGFLEKSMRKGLIRLNGEKTSCSSRIEAGQILSIPVEVIEESHSPSPKTKTINPKHKQMLIEAILYKDENIIVLNKPAGLAVQGGNKVAICLDDMLGELCFEKTERPKLVHRLDKDTSGILLLARSARAATILTQAFQRKNIQKIYWAAVLGRAPLQQGSINLPLAKSAGNAGYEQVREDLEKGEDALTFYRVIETSKNIVSWLELRPVTGRTHQLRVHCQSMGTPILGDGKYGGKESFIDGIAPKMNLHARQLLLPNLFGKEHVFTAPLPPHMRDTWKKFGFREGK